MHDRVVSVDEPYRKPDGMPDENTEEAWDFLSLAR
jgi:hypothetical protein